VIAVTEPAVSCAQTALPEFEPLGHERSALSTKWLEVFALRVHKVFARVLSLAE
jgi:hypothetical protein